MKESGLWQHVQYLTGFQTVGELSISFSVYDVAKFRHAVAGAGVSGGPFEFGPSGSRFGSDSAVLNLFHKGSDSFREVSASDSLHISLYNQHRVTAHIDKYSPVAADSGFFTGIDPVRGLIHQGREAGGPELGAALIKALPIIHHLPDSIARNPGLQLFPEQPASLGSPGIFYGAFKRDF
jgi:hypothetical protein